jgi:hypothetical protein
VTATVDGAAFRNNFALLAFYQRGTVEILNLNAQECGPPQRGVGFQLFVVNRTITPGTYTLSPGSDHLGLVATPPLAVGARDVTWSTKMAGGSGTVVVTAVSATRATGTFSFVAPADASTGATGTVRVTNAAFDVTF